MTSDNYNKVLARQVALLSGEEKSNHQQPDEVLVARSSSYDDQVIKDIDRLKKMVGKRDEEINQLKEMVGQRNKEMESLKSLVFGLMKEVNLLKSTVAVREHKFDKLKSSIQAAWDEFDGSRVVSTEAGAGAAAATTNVVDHAAKEADRPDGSPTRRWKGSIGDIGGKFIRNVHSM
ncbi:hypothetical protein K2173_009825 [Erythroxylum novogranatense]|uniref:Uncharacterized protein n=1 Tax=Erythroxylum novogranatense TaxID=1862640 RepID=A0AAV8T014_9ROSI|nr:hypothetical protein K2173_009825 [Erythroxylum novogranatense]